MSHVSSAKQAEIDANLKVFIASESAFARAYEGKHLLMRCGKVIAAYVTPLEAMQAGETQFDDGMFSVQEVSSEVGDLGFYSHALYLWHS